MGGVAHHPLARRGARCLLEAKQGRQCLGATMHLLEKRLVGTFAVKQVHLVAEALGDDLVAV
eukprot:5914979-Heterocapsa_arctica.AAC.1